MCTTLLLFEVALILLLKISDGYGPKMSLLQVLPPAVSPHATHFVKYGDVPFHVSLRYVRKGEMIHFCSGTLISDDLVITAAHCMPPYDKQLIGFKIVVVAGSVDDDKSVKLFSQQNREVRHVHLHPRFKLDNSHFADLALLKLASPFSINFFVRNVSLPTSPTHVGAECNVSGWGLGVPGDKPHAMNFLRYLKVVTVPNHVCDKFQKSYKRRYDHQYSTEMGKLCAITAEAHGSCPVDSGGPLICNHSLAGVVAYSIKECQTKDIPDVYTDIWYFRGWICEYVRVPEFCPFDTETDTPMNIGPGMRAIQSSDIEDEIESKKARPQTKKKRIKSRGSRCASSTTVRVLFTIVLCCIAVSL